MSRPKELVTELKQVCSSVRMDLQNWPDISETGKARVLQALDKFETASQEDVDMFGDDPTKEEALKALIELRTVHAREMRSMYESLLKAAHDMESLVRLEEADPVSFKAILVVKMIPQEEPQDPKVLPN